MANNSGSSSHGPASADNSDSGKQIRVYTRRNNASIELQSRVDALQAEVEQHKLQIELKTLEAYHNFDMYRTVRDSFDILEKRFFAEMEGQREAYKQMYETAWTAYAALQAEWKALAEDNIALKEELLELKFKKD